MHNLNRIILLRWRYVKQLAVLGRRRLIRETNWSIRRERHFHAKKLKRYQGLSHQNKQSKFRTFGIIVQ